MKSLIILLVPLLLLCSCSTGGNDTKDTTVGEGEERVLTTESIEPETLKTLENYAGKILNQEGSILLTNIRQISHSNASNRYDIYTGNREPKYCKPSMDGCKVEQFILITEKDIPKYYNEMSEGKYSCTDIRSQLPENIANDIISSFEDKKWCAGEKYSITKDSSGNTILATPGGEKNICPPGMYPKGLDGCLQDHDNCSEGQTLTGFPGSQYCIAISSDSPSIRDLGSGFTFAQVEEETTLSYSGKVIKTWSHTPPEKVPFVWDEACVDFFEAMDMINPAERSNNPNWKQDVWDRFDTGAKKSCMKEYFQRNIQIKGLNKRFYEILQLSYETISIWIYDTKTNNIQTIPAMGNVELSETENSIVVTVENLYGEIVRSRFIYDTNFSTLVSR